MRDGESHTHFILARQVFHSEAISIAEGKFHCGIAASYAFSFAVLIDEMRILLIFPESVLSLEYIESLIKLVLTNNLNQYSVS